VHGVTYVAFCEVTKSLQVQQLLVKLNDLVTRHSQFDELLTAIMERLDVTDRLLDKYGTDGNVDVIAAHINSVKVQN